MSKKTIQISAIILLLVFIATILLIGRIFPNEDEVETETMYCGPNNTKPVKVFKFPTRAFPTFVKEHGVKITTGVDVLDSIKESPTIKGHGSVDINDKIVELEEKLNQESARLEMIMKSNFFAYNSNPCDSLISRNYYSLLNTIAEKNSELESFRAKLTIPLNKGGNTRSDFTVITDTAVIKSEVQKLLSEYKFEK